MPAAGAGIPGAEPATTRRVASKMGRFSWDTCEMERTRSAALMLASMVPASSAAISYFKQLPKDQADPVINPARPSVIRPGTLHLPEPDPGDSTSRFYDPSTIKRFDFGDEAVAHPFSSL